CFPFGYQSSSRMPFGTYVQSMRGVGFAAVRDIADSAGTIASSSGSPTVTPTPRRKVRRGNAILVMNIVISSIRCSRSRRTTHLERNAPHQAEHDGGKPVI